MPVPKLKIVLWCNNAANQKALAFKVSEKFNLVGIIVEQKKASKRKSVSSLFIKFLQKLFFGNIDQAWKKMMKFYSHQYPEFPASDILHLAQINSDLTFQFTQNLQPDVILVSGTSLIKNNLLMLKPQFGILNLHTGLSPYVKGGPNCTNWCLANNEFHLIGNTVMWIDEGIDSGNIVSTRPVDFNGNENLYNIHKKVMESAHHLVLDVLQLMEKDVSLLPDVNQNEIAEGKIYFNKMWNWKARKSLLGNISGDKFKHAILSDEFKQKRATIKSIALS